MIVLKSTFWVADVDGSQLSTDTKEFLSQQATATWKDQILNEHIFEPDRVIEETRKIENTTLKHLVCRELTDLREACNRMQCDYFRVSRD